LGVVSDIRLRGPWRLLTPLLTSLCLSLLASAAAISYTVQVVAVSDQEVALELQGQLLRQGFPAYVVRASTADRDVYRVRVGAFANRGAALSYAEAMPEVFGSQPIPALAETIPGGIMPLEPELLLESDVAVGLTLLPWNDGVAARVQPDVARQASYHLFSGPDPVAFSAWFARPVEAGVLRVRNLSLWPSTWSEDGDEVRQAFLRSMLSLVATELALPVDEVEPTVFGGEPPFLVVLERADPLQSEPGELLALGLPDEVTAFGPLSYREVAVEVPSREAPLYTYADDVPQTPLEGEGWLASADEGFTRIDPSDGNAGWRAGVGVPLWSSGRYLLTTDGQTLRLFRLVPR
jgi:hypothetical protein